MRKLTTREKVLLALLGVGAVIALFALQGDGLGLGDDDDDPVVEGPDGDPPVVRMDLLAREAADFDPAGRNLFDYYKPPKPAPPPAPPPPPRKPPPRVERPKPPPRAEPVQRAPTPPFPRFKYLGYLGPKSRRIAVFEPEDGEGDLMLAAVGDVVEEEFRLKEFRFESVIFGYEDEQFKDRTTELSMSEN
jgi:hypothetical protein